MLDLWAGKKAWLRTRKAMPRSAMDDRLSPS